METKVIIAVIAAAIVITAGVGTAIAMNSNNNSTTEEAKDFTPAEIMSGAKLKVLGNVNKDGKIDQSDVDALQSLVNDGKSYNQCPIADANNDKKIDSADVEIVKKIVAKESTEIYHINYHDADSDGVMDILLEKTKYPISSCIISGSANTSITLMMLGIIDQVKGAAYSATSLDPVLYKNTFLNTEKVKKIGTSATTIKFESGTIGTSQTIKSEDVTALISDWNRSYITNYEDFEGAGVDVVRGASASVDPEIVENTFRTYGLLFNVDQTRVDKVSDLYSNTLKDISTKAAGISSKVKAVACSTTGSISAGNSDYTALLEFVGAEFGLEGYDAAGSASVKVAEDKKVFTYDFTKVVHIRTGLAYKELTSTEIEGLWNEYTDAFATWDSADPSHSEYIVTGAVPVPVRAAYVGTVLYPEVYSADWAKGIHSSFIELYTGVSIDLDALTFTYTENI